MPNYWVCRQDENGGFISGWVGPTSDVDEACRWAEFYTRQTFTGSCSLASVVRGDLGDEGVTIIEYLRGRAMTPDEVTLKIPDSVDEKRPPF